MRETFLLKCKSSNEGTNINDAILTAIRTFPDAKEFDTVIFLTDGEATSGITDSDSMLSNFKVPLLNNPLTMLSSKLKGALNNKTVTIHTISFGSGADYKLLRQIAQLVAS